MAYAGNIPRPAVTCNNMGPMGQNMMGHMPPPHPPPRPMPLPPQQSQTPHQQSMPPPPRPGQLPISNRTGSMGDQQSRQMQAVPNLMSITSKMANMQSIYDQATRPLPEVGQNRLLNVSNNHIPICTCSQKCYARPGVICRPGSYYISETCF